MFNYNISISVFSYNKMNNNQEPRTKIANNKM